MTQAMESSIGHTSNQYGSSGQLTSCRGIEVKDQDSLVVCNQTYTSGNSCSITNESDQDDIADDDEVKIKKSSLGEFGKQQNVINIVGDAPDYNQRLDTLPAKINKTSIEARSQVALQ